MRTITGLKTTIDDACDFVSHGGIPRSVVARNKKTGCSILDNVPQLTCAAHCPIASRCYDIKVLQLRPNVMKSRCQRHFYLKQKPGAYADKACEELSKLDLSAGVRVYGGGDFEPNHSTPLGIIMTFFSEVDFYMISKTIRMHPVEAWKLLYRHKNFVLNLSEAKGIRFDSVIWKEIKQTFSRRVQTVYTLMPEETDFSQALRADIVFNVSKRKADIARYKAAGLKLCGCDAKDFPSKDACASCGRCQGRQK